MEFASAESFNIHAAFCMDNQCIGLALTRRADFCMRPLKKCAHTHTQSEHEAVS